MPVQMGGCIERGYRRNLAMVGDVCGKIDVFWGYTGQDSFFQKKPSLKHAEWLSKAV